MESFSKKNGVPIWGKSVLTKKNVSFDNITGGAGTTDTIVFLPLIAEGKLTVGGFIKAEINNGIKLSYSLAKDFKTIQHSPPLIALQQKANSPLLLCI